MTEKSIEDLIDKKIIKFAKRHFIRIASVYKGRNMAEEIEGPFKSLAETSGVEGLINEEENRTVYWFIQRTPRYNRRIMDKLTKLELKLYRKTGVNFAAHILPLIRTDIEPEENSFLGEVLYQRYSSPE
jgi:hypothetical protein